MSSPLGGWFNTSAFMPHGHCYLWQPALLGMNVAADGAIALSYYAIPPLLFYFARRRRDVPFSWLFVMFGAFILACGTTHLMEIWTIWEPQYWIAAFLKVGTAAISLATTLALVPVLPLALAMRSPKELERLNATLEVEIAHRRRAEAESAARAAELSRSNAELENFAHMASHDLREPLRTIGSFTQLLARRSEGKLDADSRECMEHTLNGVRRMERLLDDLLLYSRAGSAVLTVGPVSCDEALRHVLEDLRVAIEESDARITFDPLPVVSGDQVQIEQLLQNLVANALKFRGDEAPRVHITVSRDSDFWRLNVADNGIGVPAEYADRIFSMFQRLHPRGEYAGTGVGLAICSRIVQRHGGRLWVEANPIAGAVFCFTLPIGPAHTTPASHFEPPALTGAA